MITSRAFFAISAVSVIGISIGAAFVRLEPAPTGLEPLGRYSSDRIQQAFKAAARVPTSALVMFPLLHKGDRNPTGCGGDVQTDSKSNCGDPVSEFQPGLILEEPEVTSSLLTQTIGLRMAGLPDDADSRSKHDGH
jgi:hypothetical protein